MNRQRRETEIEEKDLPKGTATRLDNVKDGRDRSGGRNRQKIKSSRLGRTVRGTRRNSHRKR